MDHRYTELRRNTLIIAISNICSKSIAFILAPLYSFYLTTSQYGSMDIVTTSVSLITPIICLDIYEAVFRFSNDDNDRHKLLSSSLPLTFPSLLVLIGALVYYFLYKKNDILLYTCLYLTINTFCNILEQYNRGIRRMRVFAIAGVVNSVFLLLFNYIFLIRLRMELKGWLISFVLAKACEVVYLMVASRIWQYCRFSSIDSAMLKEMLIYCIPLLPTTTMWWVMNAADRYMLTWFVSVSATGIYSVAHKIPSLLSIFERIFYQSWQTSAIRGKDEVDYEAFYSGVFNKYLSITSIGILGVMLVGKEAVRRLFAPEYFEAWYCVAPLLLSVLIHSLSGNLGTIYVSSKKTKGALITSIYGAMTNIILNAALIPRYGMIGAAYTTLAGYLVTLIVRWFDTRQFVKIKLERGSLVFFLIVLVASSVLYYFDGAWSIALRAVLLCVAIAKEHKTILGILTKFHR